MTKHHLFILALCSLTSACNLSVGEAPKSDDTASADLLPTATLQATQTNAGNNGNQAVVSSIYNGTSYTRIGRFDARNPNFVRFNYQLSKLGISFTGTSLSATLADTGSDAFDLFVDGLRYVKHIGQDANGCDALLTPGPQPFDANSNWGACLSAAPSTNPNTYLLVKNLPQGDHTAWLIKRTEFDRYDDNSRAHNTGTVTFYNFSIDEGAHFLEPPAAKSRRILFSGDSGYTGYGSAHFCTQQTPFCLYAVAEQDAYMGIAEYTGELLNADAENVACTGEAVYDSVYDSNPNHNLPVTFEQTLGNDPSLPYDFSTDPMDVVVLVAGGDDLWGNPGSGSFRNPQLFHTTYVNWLKSIRAHYPRALIVSAITQAAQGNDIVVLRDAYTSAIAERKVAGDSNIELFYYFTNDSNGWTNYNDVGAKGKLGWACAYHPSAAGSYWLAERLSAFIRQRMGW